MFKSATSLHIAAIFALSMAPLASAADCSLVGYKGDNSIWGGPGAPTMSGYQGFKAYKDGKEIWSWKPGTFDSGICSHKHVTPTGIKEVGWSATCGEGKIKECHGAYQEIDHIDGDEPSSDSDFYGLGVSSSSQCRITFKC